MKPTTLLLTASLIANLALFAYVATRPAPAPAHAAPLASALAKNSPPAAAPAPSEDDARALAVGRAFAKLQQRNRGAQPAAATDAQWWRRPGFGAGKLTAEQRAELAAAQREFSDALRAAYGDDASLSGPGGGDSRLAFLSATKRDALARIRRDYQELQSEVTRDMNGIQLSSDRAKLKLLRAEQEKDLAALLSPAELEQYQFQNSTTANNVRNRYGEAIASEGDYRKIFAIQQAFDDKFPMEDFIGGARGQDYFRQRSAAEAQLQAELKSALGADSYAALQRAADQEYKALASLTTRLNLAATATDTVMTLRDSYAAASQAISADTSLTPQVRRAQVQALADRAKADLATTLGTEGADAFASRAQWLNLLKSGMAYTTDPKSAPAGMTMSGSSVFPIMPAGARVNMNVSTGLANGTTGGALGSPAIFIGGGGGQPNLIGDQHQVITIVSGGAATPTPAPTTTPATPAPTGKP